MREVTHRPVQATVIVFNAAPYFRKAQVHLIAPDQGDQFPFTQTFPTIPALVLAERFFVWLSRFASCNLLFEWSQGKPMSRFKA